MTRQAGPCGKLFHTGNKAAYDVCGLPAGHEGDHYGRFNGVSWRKNELGENMITAWDEKRVHDPMPRSE